MKASNCDVAAQVLPVACSAPPEEAAGRSAHDAVRAAVSAISVQAARAGPAGREADTSRSDAREQAVQHDRLEAQQIVEERLAEEAEQGAERDAENDAMAVAEPLGNEQACGDDDDEEEDDDEEDDGESEGDSLVSLAGATAAGGGKSAGSSGKSLRGETFSDARQQSLRRPKEARPRGRGSRRAAAAVVGLGD